MSKVIPTFFLALTACLALTAQETLLYSSRAAFRSGPATFNPDWAPFYHGVASGDPLEGRIIIWTRVTPEEMNGEPIEVSWKMATDVQLENVVQNGTVSTGPGQDYTVKVDVMGLQPGTTYYYLFTALNKNSLIGKTKTTPVGDEAGHLKFGVVSCSNFQAGYFNAYKRLSERTDLDAIIHLGDYIYEYRDGQYGDSGLFADRPLEPPTEIVTLEEYRTRYSTYRLDTALVRAHQQHPFITVWDDHESANDSYVDGAQNHDPNTEGEWEARKAAAKQAYFEWMPIRDTEDRSVYRKISYGNLMDLILLDTRLEGREEQLDDAEDPALFDPERTLLGAGQKAWFLDQLANSTARWKVVGQQVLFSEFNIGWAALVESNYTFNTLESLFLDIWDGYPAERASIIDFIEGNGIDDVVVLAGDFHCAFAFDVTAEPVSLEFQVIQGLGPVPFYNPSGSYDAATGEGSIAVEFAAPSLTSANFDENLIFSAASILQGQINTPINPLPGFNLGNPNPHMKFADLIQHGYFILDVQQGRAQADWYFSPIGEVSTEENFAGAWYSNTGENHLRENTQPSPPKAQQDVPAPYAPPLLTGLQNKESVGEKFAVLALYPNPFQEQITLHYSLSEPAKVTISLYDNAGKEVRQMIDEQLPPGIYSLQLDAGGLAEGAYIYHISVDGRVYTAKALLGR
ncbi:MAG: alkaline phosphatase D family protein [Lewinellaceae bacterium]|nr:alkaline phosphatase D family protein [Lewinellaceae bacterium]